MLDRIIYNTVLSQVYSPCGRYLLAGNTYGQLAVFDLDHVLNPPPDSTQSDFNKPKKIHTIDSESQICSLESTEQFLIIGTTAEITGWDWKTITSSSKPIKAAWKIQIPSNKTVIEQRDVNSLWVSEDARLLFAGCGDNAVHCFHLEDGRLLRSYRGHTDYIHCVHGKGSGVVSAGEDGEVRMWDTRAEAASAVLTPHTHASLARPDLGKWVGAVAVNDDWIVCGGGPRGGLWHARSREPVAAFPTEDQGLHAAALLSDSVLLGGAAPHVYLASYAAHTHTRVPVSPATVYSAALRPDPALLCVAGSSDRIDLCTTLLYRDVCLAWR